MRGQPPRETPSLTVGRMRTRSDFLAARGGDRRKGPFFVLEVLDRRDDALPRVGYTVTKRQGNAVERNRMRRRLREAVRIVGPIAMRFGHDYVIVARRDVLDASFPRLTSALKARIESPHTSKSAAKGHEAAAGKEAQHGPHVRRPESRRQG